MMKAIKEVKIFLNENMKRDKITAIIYQAIQAVVLLLHRYNP